MYMSTPSAAMRLEILDREREKKDNPKESVVRKTPGDAVSEARDLAWQCCVAEAVS